MTRIATRVDPLPQGGPDRGRNGEHDDHGIGELVADRREQPRPASLGEGVGAVTGQASFDLGGIEPEARIDPQLGQDFLHV